MKVLVIKTDMMLGNDVYSRICSKIREEVEQYGSATIPHGFTYEIVDVDSIHIDVKLKEN